MALYREMPGIPHLRVRTLGQRGRRALGLPAYHLMPLGIRHFLGAYICDAGKCYSPRKLQLPIGGFKSQYELGGLLEPTADKKMALLRPAKIFP